MTTAVAAELAAALREADVLVGRQREALADIDRAYTRMLREQDEARGRYDALADELREVAGRIALLRGMGTTASGHTVLSPEV